MKNILFIIIILLCATPVLSVEMTGSDMLEGCKYAINGADETSSLAVVSMGQCIGYVAGITNGIIYAERNKVYSQKTFCFPSGVTTVQEIRVVVKYLENHPEKLHEDITSLVIKALMDAFPCK